MPNEQEIILGLQDQLVQRAEALVLGLNLAHEKKEAIGHTQSSKAIAAANTAPTLLVLVNWIRYQAAREQAHDQFWTRKNGSNSLAKDMTVQLAWIQHQVQTQSEPSTSDADKNRITMQVVLQFIGYFRRALIGAKFLDTVQLKSTNGEGV